MTDDGLFRHGSNFAPSDGESFTTARDAEPRGSHPDQGRLARVGASGSRLGLDRRDVCLQNLQIVQLAEHVLRALDRTHVRRRCRRPLSAATSRPYRSFFAAIRTACSRSGAYM